MRKQSLIVLICSVCVFAFVCSVDLHAFRLPKSFDGYIHAIRAEEVGGVVADVKIVETDANTLHIKLSFELQNVVRQDDWTVAITPAFKPLFHWAPHLTPTPAHVIDQHVFRSPALIVSDNERVLTVIPDLYLLGKGSPVRWYMDMDAESNILTLGMSNNEVTSHVLYERTPGAQYPQGVVEFGFYVMKSEDEDDIRNPFRKPLSFMWNNWGQNLYREGNPLKGDLSPYVHYTYQWAFDTWAESVWQEFSINGKTVGAPVFIVNTTQSPNYKGHADEREFRSVWNQAWFSSLRSAGGLFRYARRTGDRELMKKANMTKELALSFPQKEGFFFGLIGTEMEPVEIDGKKYNRSKGWDTHYWGNSNRNPYTWDARQSPFHILDMSWTALLMLRWHEELEKDVRLLQYAEGYGKALVEKQDAGGFFPGWLDTETLQPTDYLNDSPETSMSVTFLLKLYDLTGDRIYRSAALKAMDAVMKNVIPSGRWEDFETYWSCCRVGTTDWIGKKVPRNNMFKQCNFSMFWTAEALFECYKETGEEKYLRVGQRTLDELLMTQASWQPPYIYVNTLGGFGVMNTDGEWNDSRGSLFAEIILQYGELTGLREYGERGISALRASFAMMYCPENPTAKIQWEKVWPFFGKEDYGFTMENYGHGGRTSAEGAGIGEFTIYDWGNGAASEAYNRIVDKFGRELFEQDD
jgi:hypothetical protein